MNLFGSFCEKNNLQIHSNTSVLAPDNTTFFCTSGMHRLKPHFKNTSHFSSFTNIQRCLRLVDLDEIGDSTHYLVFHMLGLFSFRQWSVQKSVDFWMSFLSEIELSPDYVTLHPDKYEEWKSLYRNYHVDIKLDPDCVWSDGELGGYCTEFYKNDIEIGNIVNTLGTCIDVGFGGERLLSLKGLLTPLSKTQILKETIDCLLLEEVKVTHSGPGFVLKKLLTQLYYEGESHDSLEYLSVKQSMDKKVSLYLEQSKKPKFKDKSNQWWKDTHGLEVDKIINLVTLSR